VCSRVYYYCVDMVELLCSVDVVYLYSVELPKATVTLTKAVVDAVSTVRTRAYSLVCDVS
jgi:hypothetical protein